MADYYSILKKTLSGLPRNTAENRKIVYGKARQAIDRQLRSLTPAPAEAAITRQMKLLEEAIDTIEAEAAAGEGKAGPAAPVVAPKPATGAAVKPPAPQAGQRESIQRDSGQPARPAATSQPMSRPTPPEAGWRPRPEASRPALSHPGPPRPGPAPVAGRPGGPKPAEPAPSRQSAAGPASGRPAAAGPASPEPAYDATLDALDEFDRKPEAPERARRTAPESRSRKRGRVMPIVLTLVVLGLLGAGGYALWLNKDPLMAALGLGPQAPGEPVASGEAGPSRPEPAQSEEPARQAGEAAESGKEDVRLSQTGETIPGIPADGEAGQPATPAPAQLAREAGEPAPRAAQGGQPVQVNPVGDGQDATAEAGSQAGAAAPAQEETAPPAQPSAPPAIAQKAFLYEEGSAGGGATRDNAAIVWSLEEEPPAEGMPPEAMISGHFDVPGRGLTMQILVKRNTDEALPASHIIELRFDTPPDFSGGSIDNVARFVMKSSEQARGEGLVAVPAKIDTGYFLIALNNLAQAVETNRKLLIDSTWIDIPVGYTSGKRALVTLEKGAIGDKVFRDAFADWEKR